MHCKMRSCLARDCDRFVILTDMNAIHRNLGRDFGVVVDDKRDFRARRDFVKLGCKVDKLINRTLFAAELNEIDTAVDHRLKRARRIRGRRAW